MRLLAAIAFSAMAVAVPAASGAGSTELRITFWPQGQDQPDVRRSTLRCDPAGGTVPNAAAACRRLVATRSPFAPIAKDAVCTQIYGGPSVALVRGRYRGQRIWTLFRRSDGCHISRWERVRFLLPRPLPVSAGS